MIAPPSAPALSAPAPAAERQAQLRDAAEAFEAIFLRQMIGAMRSASLATDELAGASSAPFRDMMDARIADDMSGSAGLGIADMLLAQFSRKANS